MPPFRAALSGGGARRREGLISLDSTRSIKMKRRRNINSSFFNIFVKKRKEKKGQFPLSNFLKKGGARSVCFSPLLFPLPRREKGKTSKGGGGRQDRRAFFFFFSYGRFNRKGKGGGGSRSTSILSLKQYHQPKTRRKRGGGKDLPTSTS